MKSLLFSISGILLLFNSDSFAQLTPGIRFTNTDSYIGSTYDDVRELNSININGITPFVNLESKRFIVQASYTRYFNLEKSLDFSFYNNNVHQLEYNKATFKPSELSLMAGFKFNANHPLKIYPMIGFSKYTLGIVEKMRYNEIESSSINQMNLVGVSTALGAYYTVKRFIVDVQLKFARLAGPDSDNASNLTFSAGVGYQLNSSNK